MLRTGESPSESELATEVHFKLLIRGKNAQVLGEAGWRAQFEGKRSLRENLAPRCSLAALRESTVALLS